MSSRTAIDPPSYEQAVGSAKTTVETEIGCNSLPQVQSTSTSSSLLPKPSQLAQRRTEEMVRSQLQQLAETRFLREQNSRSNPCKLLIVLCNFFCFAIRIKLLVFEIYFL